MATYHVTLDSQGYMLDLQTYRKSVGSQIAAKQREGDLDYGDFTHLSVWAQEDWRGGLGYEGYGAGGSGGRAPSLVGYDSGVFLDSAFGDLRVGPVLTSVHNPGGGALGIWEYLPFDGSVYAIREEGAQIYSSADGITWADTGYASGETALRGMAIFDGLLLVGSGGDGDIHRWNRTNWALWGTVAGVSKATSLASWYRSSSSNLVYIGATKTNTRAALFSGTTVPAFTEIFETEHERIDALIVWDNALWIAGVSDAVGKAGALYRYDGTNFTKVTDIPHNAITAFAVFGDRLYAGSLNHGKVWQVSTQGLSEIFEIPDVTQIGGTSAYALAIRGMVVHNERLYLAVVDADGLGVYSFDGVGWSKPSTGGLGQQPRDVMSFNSALLVGMRNAGGGRTYRIAQTASTSGTFVSSWFDAELAGVDKALIRLTIRHGALAASEAISVDYAIDDSDVWTNLGTSDVDGATERTFTFAAGVKAKKVRLRLILSLVTTSATPKVRGTLLEYQVAPDVKAEWTFDVLLEGTTELPLILLDQDVSPVTGAQLADTLWASKAKKQTLSFTDIDGEAKTVLFRDIEERVVQRSQRKGYSTRGRVTLVEA